MENKPLIITGANGNLGSYIAEQFLVQGEELILILHENDHRVKDLPTRFPGAVHILHSDLNDYENLESSVDTLLKTKQLSPKGLIHTATLRSSDFLPLADSDRNMWYKVVDVNLKGTYNILKIIIPWFRKSNYGRIVMIASNVTRIGLPRGSAYSAAKAGIANIGRSIAVEEAGNNILINTISPGPIKIDDSHFSESYRQFRQQYYKERLKQIPLKRYARFADIHGLCKFLISADNTYITGEEFFVTGGKL